MKKQPRPLSAQELQAIEDLKAKISVRKAAEKNGLKPTKVFELRKRYLSDNATVQAEAADSSSNIPVAAKGDGNPPSSPPAKAKTKKHLSAEERKTIRTTLREMQAEGARKSQPTEANESDVPGMWVAAINCRLRLKVNRQQEAEIKTELGFHLMAVKARLEHGDWLKQLRLFCPIHERTAESTWGWQRTVSPSST